MLQEWLPKTGPVYFYPNPGNAGDALIAAATWQVFDRLNLRPLLSRPANFEGGAAVILGGGGNLVPFYSDIRLALDCCLKKGVKKCLLLPHTIRGHEELLSRLDARFTLCCRDMSSFEHVARHARHADRLLADDMALSLDIGRLSERTASLRHRISLHFDRDWRKGRKKWRQALNLCRPDNEGLLKIIRSDRERIDPEGGPEALDLPHHFRVMLGGRAGCEQVAFDLIHHLKPSKKIVTNRLHIAIAAILLGVDLEVIDNTYGKLSAVLDFSLPGKVVVRASL